MLGPSLEGERAIATQKALAEAQKTAAEAGQNIKIEIARTALSKGFDNGVIVKLTGLSTAQIQELRNGPNFREEKGAKAHGFVKTGDAIICTFTQKLPP